MASSQQPPAAPGPVPRPAPLSVRISPPSNRQWLQDYARDNGMSVSAVVSGLVEGLRRYQTKLNEGKPAHHDNQDEG